MLLGMDKPKATPKDFFLWAGAMLALYIGTFSFLSLMFSYIDYAFRDAALPYFGDPYQGGIAYEMASLIVLAPVLLAIMRVIRRAIAADPSRSEVWVRRWGLFLTLFAAGATIVVDLIVLITAFLSGEDLTTAFLLKVLVVLLVAAAGFMHFSADLWGYWAKNPNYARYINWAVALLVVLTIASGFFIIGSPQSQRMYRVDDQRVSDLGSIQSYLVYTYYQNKQALPTTLSQLNDSISGFMAPVDPETKQSYEYKVTGPLSFELCATFNAPTREMGPNIARPASPYGGISDNWQHGAGRTCFERTIDPQLYPQPAPKPL
jgi:hypothetical protein